MEAPEANSENIKIQVYSLNPSSLEKIMSYEATSDVSVSLPPPLILQYHLYITEITIKQDLLKTFVTMTNIIVLVYLAIPSITIIVRRLHDLNLSGVWIFLDIPIIMVLYLLEYQNIGITVIWIVSLIFFFKETKGANKHGKEPK